MLKLTSKQTSSSEKLLRSIKIDEGKCEDEIGVFCFTTKASRATFTTNATIFKVRIMP